MRIEYPALVACRHHRVHGPIAIGSWQGEIEADNGPPPGGDSTDTWPPVIFQNRVGRRQTQAAAARLRR